MGFVSRASTIFAALLLILALSAERATALSLQDARHLLSRTGFGVSLSTVSLILGQSRAEAVGTILSDIRREPIIAMPSWVDRWRYPFGAIDALGPSTTDLFYQNRWHEIEAFRAWWLAEMIATPSPLTERLVLFWHNHFVTTFENSNNSQWLAAQNRNFRRLGSGNFRALAGAMIRDPALIHYLDNHTSTAESPNENLAREWFELFTLGEGRGYIETDIKAAARALTGHSIDEIADMTFRFDRGTHDHGVKRVLGQSGRFNGDDLVALSLAHPRFGEYIIEKFWFTFVSDQIDPEEIARLSALWREMDFEIVPLLRALFLSEAFWAPRNRGRLIKSPVELVVGTVRSLGLSVDEPAVLPRAIRRMGQDLFDAPNVGGWPGGAYWITEASTIERSNFLANLLAWRTSSTGRSTIGVRVAAEDFGGPTTFRVLIDGRDAGTHTVPFGRDSVALGPAKEPEDDLVFSTIQVPYLKSGMPVSRIEIRFEKDRFHEFSDGRTGDRNLYVRWVEANGTRVQAQSAEARGGCIDPNWKVGLWCEGRLIFDVNQNYSTMTKNVIRPDAQPSSKQRRQTVKLEPRDLRVGLVVFGGAGDLEEEDGAIGVWSEFLLYDVELNDRRWRAVFLRFEGYKTSDGLESSISFRQSGCFPICFEHWPASRDRDDGPSDDAEFHLSAGNWERLADFDTRDRNFVQALIAHLPKIVEITRGQEGWREIAKKPKLRRTINWIANDLARILRSTEFVASGRFVRAVSHPEILGVNAAMITNPGPRSDVEMMMRAGRQSGVLARQIAKSHRSYPNAESWLASLPTRARDSTAAETLLMAVPVNPDGRRRQFDIVDPSALIRRLVLDPRYQLN